MYDLSKQKFANQDEEQKDEELKKQILNDSLNVKVTPDETIQKDTKNFLRVKNEVAPSFNEFLDEKKKKLDEDKITYTELLNILYRNGDTKKN